MSEPTDAELEQLYPHVPWRAPLLTPVLLEDDLRGTLFICRYCAARRGIPPTVLAIKTRAEIRQEDEDLPSSGEVEGFGPILWSSSDHQEHLDRQHQTAVVA